MDLPICTNWHHLSSISWNIDNDTVVGRVVVGVLPTESAFDKRDLSQEVLSKLVPAIASPPEFREESRLSTARWMVGVQEVVPELLGLRNGFLRARDACRMKDDF